MFLTKEKTLASEDIILKAESNLSPRQCHWIKSKTVRVTKLDCFKISIYAPRETKYELKHNNKIYHFVY